MSLDIAGTSLDVAGTSFYIRGTSLDTLETSLDVPGICLDIAGTSLAVPVTLWTPRGPCLTCADAAVTRAVTLARTPRRWAMRARSLYVRIGLHMTYFHFSVVCVQFLLMRRTSMRDSTCSVLRAPMRDLIFFRTGPPEVREGRPWTCWRRRGTCYGCVGLKGLSFPYE